MAPLHRSQAHAESADEDVDEGKARDQISNADRMCERRAGRQQSDGRKDERGLVEPRPVGDRR